MSDKPDTTATGVYLVHKRKRLPFLVYLAWILVLVASAVMVFFLAWPVVNLQLQNLVMVRIPLLHERPDAGVPDVYLADVSADGRYVVYNVLLDQTRSIGETGPYSTPAISADGRYIAYRADIDQLVIHDQEERSNSEVRPEMVPNGRYLQRVTPYVTSIYLSADGRFIVFSSFAGDLVPADINFANDLFIHDRVLDHTTRLSPVSWQAMLFFVLLFLDVVGAVIVYNSRRVSKSSEEDFSTYE